MFEENMSLKEKLKMLRVEKGWSQEQAASALFVDHTAISKWENGKRTPTFEMLNNIAKVYGVDVKELDPNAKAIMVRDVSKGRYICQFEPNEKGWQVVKRAWKNSVAFRCLMVAAITAEVLILWTAISPNTNVYNLSIVAGGAALLIGESLWPSKKKLDKLLVKVSGVLAVIALVLVGAGVQW